MTLAEELREIAKLIDAWDVEFGAYTAARLRLLAEKSEGMAKGKALLAEIRRLDEEINGSGGAKE